MAKAIAQGVATRASDGRRPQAGNAVAAEPTASAKPWWHQINVEAIEDAVPGGKFPRATKWVGKSPPQYLEEDE
jgi:hypothetical protein